MSNKTDKPVSARSPLGRGRNGSQRIAKIERRQPPSATCKQEVALIGRYVSADLSAKELAAFERHLAACCDCVAFLQTYKKTVQLTRNFLALGSGRKAAPRAVLA
jgi:anti-sigma factor RsiW